MAAFVGQTPNGACLFVKGLAKGVNEKHLALFFGSFGSLLLCQLARHRSGRSAGFAIISFGSCVDAQTALLRTDKAFFLGRQLIVRWFQPDFDGPKLDSGAFLFQTRPHAVPPSPHGATPHTGPLSSQRGMRNAYSDPGTASMEGDEQQWYGQGQQAAASGGMPQAFAMPSAMPQAFADAAAPLPSWPVDSGLKLCTWREDEEIDLRPLLPSLLLDESAQQHRLLPLAAAGGGPAKVHTSLFGELSSAGSLDYMLDIAQADFAALSCSDSSASNLLSSSAESLCGSRLLKWGVLNTSGGRGSSASSSSSHNLMRRSRSLEGSDIVVTASAAHPFGADYDVSPPLPAAAQKAAAPFKAAPAATSGFLGLPEEFPLSLDLCFRPLRAAQQQPGAGFASSAAAHNIGHQQQRMAAPIVRPAGPPRQQAGGCFSSPNKPPPAAGRSGLAHHAPAFVPRAAATHAAAVPQASSKQQMPAGCDFKASMLTAPPITADGFDAAALLQQAMGGEGSHLSAKQMQAAGFDASMLQAMGGAAGTANPLLPWALNPYAAAALQQYALAQFVSSQQNMAMAAAALGQMGGGGGGAPACGGGWVPDAPSAFAAGGGAWFPPTTASMNGLSMM